MAQGDNDALAYVLGHPDSSAPQIAAALKRPRPTINQVLARLVAAGRLERIGAGRATVYRATAVAPTPTTVEPDHPIVWSERARALQASLDRPLASRTPVTYQREFVDAYRPNETSLVPDALAGELFEIGRLPGRLPAGTYARRVLEPLLIDLSWHSSRLEGNNKSLLDTRELFQRGSQPGDDSDAVMLLNHKAAILYIVEEAPKYGMLPYVIRNIQSVLMDGLLKSDELGSTRSKVVDIHGSVYLPTQVPQLIEEMLESILEKARAIGNPVECAFFLWVNLAYLQPFADGNKRTSRLSANLPLMFANCAPLSFIDVTQTVYADAMLGLYEERDVALAVELFEWTYRRSIERYRVMVASMGAPDPVRTRYREQIADAVRRVVRDRQSLRDVLRDLSAPADEVDAIAAVIEAELKNLAIYNCARFQLPMAVTEHWVSAGRPTG